MADNIEISKKLALWAVKEMRFRDSKDCNEEAFATKLNLSGICLGPLADVWIYVIDHVKAESTVQMIQGNLKLNSKGKNEDPEVLKLIGRKEKLKLEVAELKKSNSVLHESLIESRLSIQEKEKILKSQQFVFRDLKRSSHLLTLVKNSVDIKIKSLHKSTAELEKHLQLLAPSLEKGTDLERYKIDLENMSKLMQDSLNELLNEEPNIDKINSTKMGVGNNLATLLETLPRPLLMRLIQEQQESEISQQKQNGSAVPTQNNVTPDINQQTNNSQPLQKLLYELSWAYADTRARAETAKAKVDFMKSELALKKSQLFQRLNLFYNGDEKKIGIARKLIEMEIQVASRKSTVDTLRKNLEELDSFCSRYEARQAEIEEKIATIERNSRLSDHLTALICTLARKRANHSRIIQQLASQSQKLVKEDIKTYQDKLNESIKLSKLSLESEIDIYREFKPSELFYVRISNKLVPVNQLAVNRLLATLEPSVSGTHLQAILQHLGLPFPSSVFRLLEAVGERRLQIRKTQQTLDWHETRKSEIEDKYGLSWLTNGMVRYKALAKKLEDSRNSQEAAILPSLELRRKRMNEASKCMEDIEIAVKEWSEEPAKLIDTGRSVNGQSLEQWRSVWKKSLNSGHKVKN